MTQRRSIPTEELRESARSVLRTFARQQHRVSTYPEATPGDILVARRDQEIAKRAIADMLCRLGVERVDAE